MAAVNRKGGGSPREELIQHAMVHLNQALKTLDLLNECPELGARLQGLIEELGDMSDSTEWRLNLIGPDKRSDRTKA